MAQFRLILIGLTGLTYLFSVTAVAQGGINFITPFMLPIPAMDWQAQFHVDFACYLLFSALWVAWRQGFNGRGIALALIGAPLGLMFFGPYLLVLLHQTKGDMRRFLLGVHHDAQTDPA